MPSKKKVKKRSRKKSKSGKSSSSNLTERIDRLENMVMVEQAGINEIQSLLKIFDQKFDVSTISVKVKEIEDAARRASEASPVSGNVSEALKRKVFELEKEIESIKSLKIPMPKAKGKLPKGSANELEDLRQHFRIVIMKVDELRKAVDDIKSKRVSKMPESGELAEGPLPDIGEIKNSISLLRESVEKLREKNEAGAVKISELEANISSLRESGVETPPKETVIQREVADVDLSPVNSKIGSLEEETSKIKQVLVHMEKQIDSLSKQREHKPETDASGYMNVRDLERMKKTLEGLRKDVNVLKVGYEETVDKKDMGRFLEEMRKTKGGKVDEKFREVGKSVKRMVENFDTVTAAQKKEIDDMRREVQAASTELSVIRKRVDQVTSLPKGQLPMLKNLEDRVANIEGSIKNVKDEVGRNKERDSSILSFEDAYLKQMVDKLVFIESRLAAMESSSEKPRPVVID